MTQKEYKEELQKNVQKLHSGMNKDMQLVVTYGFNREELAEIKTAYITKDEFGFLIVFVLLKRRTDVSIPIKEGIACDNDIDMVVDSKSIRYIIRPTTSLDNPYYSEGKYTFEITAFKTVRKKTLFDIIIPY